jgi:sigma-B regulation protein RsbU (phosphoserine phosphatase)
MGLRRRHHADVDVASCLGNLDRLDALERSGLMNSAPSPWLDYLTSRAARQLHTPVAAITLLDDHRQVFASSVGLPYETTETPVSESFCQFVVAFDEPVVIDDTHTDELVKDHPATASGIRSYLGVPLRSEGEVLGSMCVVDLEPREWTEHDVHSMQALVRTALKADA